MTSINTELKTFIPFSIYNIFIITYLIYYFGFNNILMTNTETVFGLFALLFSCILLVYISHFIYIIYLIIKQKKQRLQQTRIHINEKNNENTSSDDSDNKEPIVIGSLIIEE